LNQYSFPRQAIIASSTAIELIIRFMLIRPLIQAAFLTEDWAYLLTHRIATGRTDEDRELLPKLLEYHDVKIWEIKLSTGAELWPTITQTVLPKRHRIVHRGESAVLNEAKIAVECAVALREKVVLPLAKRHGFSLDATGCWNKIQKNGKSTHSYEARSPFDT
jgi:hypothetical protein